MATQTVRDILTLCLKDAGVTGVGQTPLPEDINDAFDRANMMLAQWQRKRWLVYHLVDTGIVSTGAQSYTVGIGGDINIVRPDKIVSAYLRQLNTAPNFVDYPLTPIVSYDDYSRLRVKFLTAFSRMYFYDTGFPLGTVYPWPVMPAAIYALHIITKEVLPQFTSVSQTIALPEEYKAAIFYNLACRLRPAYQMQPDPSLVALAKDALNTIRETNAQIATMRMPSGLCRGTGYSVYSDNN